MAIQWTAFPGVLGLMLASSLAWGEPPTEPASRKIYDHDREWLSKFPSAFVATNIRGKGIEYKERRQAALDLVRQQRDFGVVSELTAALEDKSFLSPQIIDILVEWKAKRALPQLKEIVADQTRDKALREKAKSAIEQISSAKVDKPPVFSEGGQVTGAH